MILVQMIRNTNPEFKRGAIYRAEKATNQPGDGKYFVYRNEHDTNPQLFSVPKGDIGVLPYDSEDLFIAHVYGGKLTTIQK